ncbi:MAG: ester cyclase [Deltaproteobacteria bacterium]|nr:ester cyclase [Deltaproteobacteria bacterium]
MSPTFTRLVVLGLGMTTLACDSKAPQTDTVEDHVAVVRRRIAANNSEDWATWQSLHTPDAVRTSPDLDEPLVGSAALRAGIESLFVTFPDYHLELVEAFGAGDRLVARIHTRATMDGPLTIDGMEIPPTGASFEQDWVAVLTFKDGLIDQIDEFYDNYGTMMQLGLMGQ